MKLRTTKQMIAHLNEHGCIMTSDVHHRRRKVLVSLIYNLKRLKGYQFEEPERIHVYGGREWVNVYRLKKNVSNRK